MSQTTQRVTLIHRSDCRECTTNTPVLVYKLCVCQTAGKAQRITPVLVYKLSVCQTAENAQDSRATYF